MVTIAQSLAMVALVVELFWEGAPDAVATFALVFVGMGLGASRDLWKAWGHRQRMAAEVGPVPDPDSGRTNPTP